MRLVQGLELGAKRTVEFVEVRDVVLVRGDVDAREPEVVFDEREIEAEVLHDPLQRVRLVRKHRVHAQHQHLLTGPRGQSWSMWKGVWGGSRGGRGSKEAGQDCCEEWTRKTGYGRLDG
eukprot:175255-Rhodomonas_salina.1